MAAGLALVAGMAALAGCDGGGEGAAGHGAIGAIGLHLDIAPGITLNTIGYTITGPPGTKMGMVDVSHSSTISGVIGNIPSGGPYTITLTSTATDGTTMCSGSNTFSVTTGMTTNVPVHMTCHLQPHTGGILVGGTLNTCPLIDGISANPAEIRVGGTLALSTTASDADGAPAPLGYHWTASSGTLSDPTAAAPAFTCTAAGTVTITLTVSDGDTTAGCPDTQSIQVTCS